MTILENIKANSDKIIMLQQRYVTVLYLYKLVVKIGKIKPNLTYVLSRAH